MASLLGKSQTEAAEAANVTVKSLREEVAAVVSQLTSASQQQAELLTSRLHGLSAAQESHVNAMSDKLRAVIQSFGDAELALRKSATELDAVARRVSEILSGTQSVVKAVDGSTLQLRSGTDAARALVQSASTVVKEAQAQASVELELTRELQRIWPQLLDGYIRSFEEKSKLLASTWTGTHTQLASLVQGTVSELSDAADELRGAVRDAARVFGDVRGRSEPQRPARVP